MYQNVGLKQDKITRDQDKEEMGVERNLTEGTEGTKKETSKILVIRKPKSGSLESVRGSPKRFARFGRRLAFGLLLCSPLNTRNDAKGER